MFIHWNKSPGQGVTITGILSLHLIAITSAILNPQYVVYKLIILCSFVILIFKKLYLQHHSTRDSRVEGSNFLNSCHNVLDANLSPRKSFSTTLQKRSEKTVTHLEHIENVQFYYDCCRTITIDLKYLILLYWWRTSCQMERWVIWLTRWYDIPYDIQD